MEKEGKAPVARRGPLIPSPRFAQPLADLPLPGQPSLELIPRDRSLTDQDFAERFAWPATLCTHHRANCPPSEPCTGGDAPPRQLPCDGPITVDDIRASMTLSRVEDLAGQPPRPFISALTRQTLQPPPSDSPGFHPAIHDRFDNVGDSRYFFPDPNSGKSRRGGNLGLPLLFDRADSRRFS
jgi:hypothetical protein